MITSQFSDIVSVMRGRVLLELFLLMLAGHGCNIVSFSYGVLQVYVYSYMHQYDPSLTMKQIHLHLPLLLGIAASTSWIQGYLARWIGARLLHCVNMCAMSGCCLVLYRYTHSYVVVTACMAGIGLSYGMLHVYFLSTVVNRVSRYSQNKKVQNARCPSLGGHSPSTRT